MPSFSASVSSVGSAVTFVTSMLGCLTSIRGYHWASDRYSEHQALGELYDDLSDLLDQFVEQYQGRYGKLDRAKMIGLPKASNFTALTYLSDVRDFIGEVRARKDFTKDSSLQNLIDEIVGKFDRTIYKLATLK